MMTLTEFLLARIAEDEEVARAATGGPWQYDPGKVWLSDPAMLALYRGGTQTFTAEEFVRATSSGDPTCVATTGPEDDAQAMADAAHIARHDPTRVLAECQVKRRIVGWGMTGDSGPDGLVFEVLHDVMRDLAAVYADHPDYREEWRP